MICIRKETTAFEEQRVIFNGVFLAAQVAQFCTERTKSSTNKTNKHTHTKWTITGIIKVTEDK